ncbi:MAG TPA: LysM peptidoglycan-binding domain-containing protein [Nitrospiria bacterium]
MPLIFGILLLPLDTRGQEDPNTPPSAETQDEQLSPEPSSLPPELPQEVPDEEEAEGPTVSEEILAPLEESPTIAEEILAPLGEDLDGEVVTGDVLSVPGPQKYIVQEGDTLWDITQTYFQDSFLWPKLWKTNKEITDPDLIYPGNIILIPGEGDVPVAPPLTAAPGVPTVPPASPVLGTTEPGETEKQAQAGPGRRRHRIEVIRPEVTSPQEFRLDLSSLPNPGYVVVKEKSIGKVVAARDGREIFGENETAYLLPQLGQRPMVGDQFTVYRSVHRVKHPKTGKHLGSLVRILGTLEVTGVKPPEKTVTAYILNSLDFIQPGDLYMPVLKDLDTQNLGFSTSAEGSMAGYIVDVKENRVGQAQHDFVFLDRGLNDGLKIGNRFVITRSGDKTSAFSPGGGVRLPSRMIGQIQVISVQDITATALILNSTEVILRGDRFETPQQP